jgi:hypothetical protein
VPRSHVTGRPGHIREIAMKNLVLSALVFAGLTQAAGCIIVSDDTSGDGTGDVDVAWSLLSSDANGNVIPSACPPGADTIQISAQRGNDIPFTDKYLCSAPGGLSDRLPAGQYAVWITITDTNGTTKFAESGAYIVDVVDGAVTPVDIDIFTDRAFFQASWQLTGAASTCAQAGAANMSILATMTGGANGFDDDSQRCIDGEAGKTVLTQTPVPIGTTYTVVVAALDAAGLSIGDSAPLTNRVLDYGNKYDNLGVVQIPIR